MPPASDEPDSTNAVLGAEREHLRRSREYLALMRADVLSLRAMGGDRVSQEYLKADLYHRAEALADLPDTPLFFGRLDYEAGESFHVGRRHVHDPHGTAAVIDWRAPVSRPFYRASQAEPMGVARRRRFGFAGGELTAFEDERFDGPGGQPPAHASRILIEEIERPRSGPMRDIVATIQPEQDDIVRADVEQTVCVQGAPGTGKTAVGLHRVAYLLYAHAQRLSRGGVLVLGPNRAFLSYIADVLPALGELDVTQLSVADLTRAVPVRGTDSDEAARIKGDVRMAAVIESALWDQLAEPADPIVLVRGSRRWRVAASEIGDLLTGLRERGVRYGTGRDMLAHQIAHLILTRMEAAGETCDDRTHEAVRRTKVVQAAVSQVWPKADPARLVFRLLSNPAVLARAADGVLGPSEQAEIAWSRPPRGPGSARWSAADAVLIDEAADLIERTPSLAHVVVDEAQDLSPMQCRAIGRRCATGSATVLGDIAQGTTAWATRSWAELLGHLGKPAADLRVLDTGYRVPRQILDFASRLLPQIAPDLRPADSVRQDPDALAVLRVAPAGLGAALAGACASALAQPGSAAVIAADRQIDGLARLLAAAAIPYVALDGAAFAPGAASDAAAASGVAAAPAGSASPGPVAAGPVVADVDAVSGVAAAPAGSASAGSVAAGPVVAGRITLIPVTLAKGLEFDQVIVVEPAEIVAAEERGLRRLYVALTRAVSRLTVLHSQPLPASLADAA